MPKPTRLPGSSPLTRGKHGGGRGLSCLVGLIPAHAGKTGQRRHGRRRNRAHPRSRGENISTVTGGIQSAGSSPLTRGKRMDRSLVILSRRLIPAHAGKTLSATSSQCVDWAHPRSRGENGHPERRVIWKVGSSPLTRGKHAKALTGVILDGLIPAHAGKTSPRPTRQPNRRAHPRSRGENTSAPLNGNWHGGSSPLTRGKRRCTDERRRHRGLIPAHAGKTGRERRAGSRPGAHPRSRGENTMVASPLEGVPGSSPLTRGKRGAGG